MSGRRENERTSKTSLVVGINFQVARDKQTDQSSSRSCHFISSHRLTCWPLCFRFLLISLEAASLSSSSRYGKTLVPREEQRGRGRAELHSHASSFEFCGTIEPLRFFGPQQPKQLNPRALYSSLLTCSYRA